MKISLYRFVLLVSLGAATCPIQAAPTLDLYGNFHTLGLTVTLDPADDLESNRQTGLAAAGGNRNGRIPDDAHGVAVADIGQQGVYFITQQILFRVKKKMAGPLFPSGRH
jgi:hypothetical protein